MSWRQRFARCSIIRRRLIVVSIKRLWESRMENSSLRAITQFLAFFSLVYSVFITLALLSEYFKPHFIIYDLIRWNSLGVSSIVYIENKPWDNAVFGRWDNAVILHFIQVISSVVFHTNFSNFSNFLTRRIVFTPENRIRWVIFQLIH